MVEKGKKREQCETWREGKKENRDSIRRRRENRAVMSRKNEGKKERGTQKEGRSWMMSVVLV